jgi:hypothetical protein
MNTSNTLPPLKDNTQRTAAAQQSATNGTDDQPSAEQSAPPKLIEVELLRKYAPFHLVGADGTAERNGAMIKETISPGIVSLHKEDAAHVLQLGIARATRNTFRD